MVTMLPYEIKREALHLRRAVEAISVDIWVTSSGLPRTQVSTGVVETRLLLLVSKADDHLRLEAFRVARQAARVYSETSDVLHGRTRASRFQSVHLEEWKADYARLEALWTILR
ncbi:conserved protein of unknown function [Agreia sp. COWG]|nr:conserved protein of unknown function [Agreia sp. COWG]